MPGTTQNRKNETPESPETSEKLLQGGWQEGPISSGMLRNIQKY
jgi:hypothetical protein